MQGERIYSGSPYEEKAGYARAAVVNGWIFVSGTTGFDAQTKEFPPDVESQCENCFRNIEIALGKAGATLKDLVRVQIFVTSQEEFERIIPIIRKHCYEAGLPTQRSSRSLWHHTCVSRSRRLQSFLVDRYKVSRIICPPLRQISTLTNRAAQFVLAFAVDWTARCEL